VKFIGGELVDHKEINLGYR